MLLERETARPMPDYDFTALNDKEFESLAVRLLSKHLDHRIERFRPGRDQGIDGRFFESHDKQIILQVKHWRKSGLKSLVRQLEQNEKPKADRLVPTRYVLTTSLPLSAANKTEISNAMHPWITRDDDVYGAEDLNDLLADHPDIEREFVKLWLSSATTLYAVLNNATVGRTTAFLESAWRATKKYHPTKHHEEARTFLQSTHVVILSGEPGAGKTILAGQLALEYAAKDFEIILATASSTEAEDMLVPNKRQLIVFDDFLGSNYLNALERNEDTQIVRLIERIVHSPNKRMILTSRTTVLNRGWELGERFRIANIRRNEYEVNVRSLEPIDKAAILYNHIWHSSLEPEFVEEIYKDRRYRRVIAHRNFNPRLIEFIFDYQRIPDIPSNQYWNYIESTLNDPHHIWRDVFEQQISQLGAYIVILITLFGNTVSNKELVASIDRLLTMEPFSEYKKELGPGGITPLLETLTGAVIVRELTTSGAARYQLFSPSIADFVINTYLSDVTLIIPLIKASERYPALATLISLKNNNILSKSSVSAVLESLLSYYFSSTRWQHVDDINFLAKLSKIGIDYGFLDSPMKESIGLFLQDAPYGDLGIYVYSGLLDSIRTAIEEERLDNPERIVVNVLAAADRQIYDDTTYELARALLFYVPDDLREESEKSLYGAVMNVAGEEAKDTSTVFELFSQLELHFLQGPDGTPMISHDVNDDIFQYLVDHVYEVGERLGVKIREADAVDIASDVDLDDLANEYLTPEPDYEGGHHSRTVSTGQSQNCDAIDDLFDRAR